MSDETSDRDPFEVVAASFLARYRAGERPSIEDLAARHPELAGPIRRLLPALVRVEQDLSVDVDVHDAAPAARGVIEGRAWRLGDYWILGEIGRGGMGVVYEAEQVSLGRRVALKVLPHRVAHDPRALERFRREAKAAARLHHTNIVPVFEVGREGDFAFYAMQLIRGQGLDQVIDELVRLRAPDYESGGPGPSGTEAPATAGPLERTSGGVAVSLLGGRPPNEGLGSPTVLTGTEPLDSITPSGLTPTVTIGDRPPAPLAPGVSNSAVLPGGTQVSEVDTSGRRQPFFRSVARIGRQAAHGLAHAHAGGIVHRDIKPSNLLLDTQGVVWIADFGLARDEDDGLTATGDLLGTLRYLAPERFRGEGDARADISALGLTLYELLTLRPAYASADRLRLIEQIKNEEPDRPRSLDGRIPRDLETIVLKAIEKAPERRYSSADAMAEDLRRFLDDDPIQARRASAADRYARWARHHPGIAVLGAVLTAVLVLSTAVSLVVAGHMADLADDRRLAADAERAARQDAVRTAKAEIAAHADADRDREAEKWARNAAALQAAELLLDRGIEDARAGEPARALHLFVRALKAIPADDPQAAPLGHAIRANLAAWAETLPGLEQIWPDRFHSAEIAYSPDGEWLAVAARKDEIWCVRTDTGRPVGPPIQLLVRDNAAMEFAADGRSLWVASPDRADFVDGWTLHRLVPVSGRPVQPPIPTTGPVNRLAVTPDGRHFVGLVWGLRPDDRGGVADADRTRLWRTAAVVAWEAASGRVVVDAVSDRETANRWPDAYLALSPDGNSAILWVQRAAKRFEQIRFAVVGDEPPVHQELPEVGDGAPWIFHFENLMRTALVIKDDQLHRWSATTPEVLGPGIPTPFRSMFYGRSADGRSVTSQVDGRFHDTGTWPPRPSGVRFNHPGWQRSDNAWWEQSPGGRFAASWVGIGEGGGRLWRLPRPHSRPALSPAESARRPGRTAAYSDAEFDPSGAGAILWPYLPEHWTQVAENTHDLRLVDATTGAARVTSIHHSALIRQAVFAPDGRHFASASFDGTAQVWEAATGRPAGPPLPHGNYVASVAFSPGGQTLAAGDYGPNGLVKFWDWRAGKEVRPPLQHDDIVLGVAFSPDGRYLAVVEAPDWSKSPEFLVWEVASGSVAVRVPYPAPSHFLRETPRFRSDDRAVALRDVGGVLRLWEVPSGHFLGERPLDGDGKTRFSPDGRMVAASANLGVRLLDGGTLAPLPAGWLSHPDPIRDLAFSPDGASLLTAHENGSAQLWDVAARKPIGPPAVLIGPILAVSFTPDGKTCVGVAADGTVRRWPVPAPFAEPDLDRLSDRVALMTGQRMDDNQGLDTVPADEWQSLRARLVGEGSTALVPSRPDADWHDATADDAEQDGDAFGAEWHLDRLAAQRPVDWTIPARRGRVLAAAGRRDEADAAYAAVRGLAPSPQVLSDWLRVTAVDEEMAGRGEAALWNPDRAIALTPEDWTLYVLRAGRTSPSRAVAEFDEAIRRGAEPGIIAQAADQAADSGDWGRSAALFGGAGRGPGLPTMVRYRQWLACLKAVDAAGYRSECDGVAQGHRTMNF
ncbi:serine/threonine-protein kinase [Tautonia plasticadhaerens]|uniref:Serine/threonine-protein kinase pkn5 n=1 Tax=Tautonia plasticadhaerens TaxID=2527974 RepID=A0A518HA01_9BACT|nr:serine/threonine-protein kinase [Tautonia plasticadhaerens]QDV37669.1 Serine/threonine-protein kinase pkn5 [Tautonia plasticadhaerens]